jgi:hypothetical protein
MTRVKVQRKNDIRHLYVNERVRQSFDTPFHISYLKIYFTAPPIQEKNPAESPKI